MLIATIESDVSAACQIAISLFKNVQIYINFNVQILFSGGIYTADSTMWMVYGASP